MTRSWALFTKPWMHLRLEELADTVAGLGFNAVELPVRANAQVMPEHSARDLPRAVTRLADRGVQITSVAGPLTPEMLGSCGDNGIPRLCTMLPLVDGDYRASVDEWVRTLAELVPIAEQTGVKIAVQPHHGDWIAPTSGVMAVLDQLPGSFEIAWDAAHAALAGELDADVSLRLASDRLGILNLKNARFRAVESGEQWPRRYRPEFVPAPDGMADWHQILTWVRAHSWNGPICLTAEYSSAREASEPARHIEELVRSDLKHAQALLGDAA